MDDQKQRRCEVDRLNDIKMASDYIYKKKQEKLQEQVTVLLVTLGGAMLLAVFVMTFVIS